jgi:hypothetical protein
MILKEAKAALEKVSQLLEGKNGKNLEEIFTSERYQKEAPDKYVQDDEHVPYSIMSMYDDWAGELSRDASVQERRLIATRIYDAVGWGRSGVAPDHWDLYYGEGTLSEQMIVGLTSTPIDPGVLKNLLGKIKPTLTLLFEAGVQPSQLVNFVNETLVEEVQEK